MIVVRGNGPAIVFWRDAPLGRFGRLFRFRFARCPWTSGATRLARWFGGFGVEPERTFRGVFRKPEYLAVLFQISGFFVGVVGKNQSGADERRHELVLIFFQRASQVADFPGIVATAFE